MEDGATEKSIHYTTIKICEDLKSSPSYKSLFADVQKLVSSPNIKYENFKENLLKAMKENGLEAELRNSVYHWVRSKKKEPQKNALESFFKKAQIQWDKRIHKSLNSMCTELGINLARVRFANDKDEMTEKWGRLSTYDVDINKYRPVYAPKDFLEVLLNLKGPNYEEKNGEPKWSISHIPLKVKDLTQLRSLYSEFSRGEQLLGVNVTSPNYAAFEMERIILGEKVLLKNYAPVAQEYLKKGSPRCLRSRLWSLVLGANVKSDECAYFQELKGHVLQYELMIDKLIIKDIHLTASNDDQYFVFEDVLYQVMLCFSRDSEVLQNLSGQPGFMQVVLKGKQTTADNTLVFPPSGVIPFHGFTMYAAPFCYLYDDPAVLYFVFRAFYLRYWHRLHQVCGHSQGILSLCLLYERLLQCYEPALWFHFKRYNIPPIRVVFKWLMRGFSGHLPPEQLLQLWDLVLGYDSLEIIPLLAVVILIFRKENLMKVSTIASIEAVLADLSSIAVMPLLQMALLKE